MSDATQPTPPSVTPAKANRSAAAKLARARAPRTKARMGTVTLQRQWTIGVLTSIGACLLMLLGLLSPLELRTIDWRAAWFDHASPPPSDKIALVAIDDAAIERVGRWPWSRDKLAMVIDELATLGASVVALDLLLDDEQRSDADGSMIASFAGGNGGVSPDAATFDGATPDDALAAAMKRHGNVIAPTNFRFNVEVARGATLDDRAKKYVQEHPELVQKWNDRPAIERAVKELALTVPEARTDADALFAMSARVRVYLKRAIALQKLTAASSFSQSTGGDSSAFQQFLFQPAVFQPPLSKEASTPVLSLANAAVMTANVTVNSYDSGGGVVRRIPIAVEAKNRMWPTLGLAAALRLHNKAASSLTVQGSSIVADLGDGRPRRIVTHWAELSGNLEGTRRGGLVMVTWPRGVVTAGAGQQVDTDWQWQFFDLASSKPAEVSIGSVYRLGVLRETLRLNRAKAKELVQFVYCGENPRVLSPEDRKLLLNAIEAGNLPASVLLLEKVKSEFDLWKELQLDGTTIDKLAAADQDVIRAFTEAADLPEKLKTADRQREQIQQMFNVLKDRLGGRIAFIGFTATGTIADFVPTSISPKTPGVHLHMATANAVLQDFQRVMGPVWLDVLATLALGVLSTFVAVRMGVIGAPLATIGLVAIWALVAGSLVWDYQRTIVAIAGPGMAGIGSSGGVLLHRLFTEQRTRRKTEERFKSYVSPKVVDILVNNPDLDSMQPQRRELSILFTDIAGFTTIAERLGSQRTAEVLRLYLGPMTETLQNYEGTLDKYIGDAIVAFWGAPVETERHAELCCRAGLAMLEKLDALNRQGTFGEGLALGMRIGLATGEVMVGDFGNPPRNSSYTVLGDTANLASRLESANKAFGSRILTTAATRAEAMAGAPADIAAWLWRPIGRINVKGKLEAVELWELIGTLRPKADLTAAWVAACTLLVDAYISGDTDGATQRLDELETVFGNDVFSSLYREGLAAIARGEAKPGTLVLHEK